MRTVLLLPVVLLWLAASPLLAADLRQASGQVEQVRLLGTSALGADDILLLVLGDGRRFHLPGRERLSAGRGVEVALGYLPASEPDAIPVACWVRVTAVPIERDGRTRLERAERPFEVYRNTSPDHEC